jgi:lysozyme
MMVLDVSADRETGEQTSRWNVLEKNAGDVNKKAKPSKQAELPESFNAIRLEGNTLIYDFDKIRYEAGLIKFEGEGATSRPAASPVNRPSPAAAPPPPPPPASASRASAAGSSGTDATPINAGSAAATTGGGNATGTDTAPISAGPASAPTGGGNATGTDTAPISAGPAASPTGGGNATGTDATPVRAGPAAASTGGGNATRMNAPSVTSTAGATPSFSGGDQQAMEMIKRHEGKRNSPYKDSLGLWTVGYGHLIGDGRSLPAEWNRTFSDQEIDALFAQDYAKHKQAAERIPGFDKANDSGKAAIIDLTFNMGPAWFRRFPNASAALARGDFETFANEMQNSLWFRQVGRRGPTIVAMLRAGGSGGAQTAATQTPATPSSGGSVAQASTERVTAGREQTMNSQRMVSNFNQQSTQREQPSNSSQTSVSQNVGEIPLRVRMLSTFNQLAQAS